MTLAVAPPRLTASCHHGIEAFLRLEPEWRALLERSRTTNPFLSWEWVSEWGRSFWGGRVVTVVVEASSGPVAIAPFHEYEGLPAPGLRTPSLELMGPRRRRYRQMFELAEALVDPDHAVAALGAVVDVLHAEERWSWIEVGSWGEGAGRWQDAIAGAAARVTGVVEGRRDVLVMDLGQSWEELRGQLRRNLKESIRHAYNAPARDRVRLDYSEHRGVTGLDPILDDLFRLHSARAAVGRGVAHPDYFADPAVRGFVRRVAHRLATADRLSLGIVAWDGRRVAVRFHMEMHGFLYLYHSGFDPDLWRYSVATLATVEAIKSAIARGLVGVNFSLGVDQAKARWNVRSVPFERVQIVRSTAAARRVSALYSGVRHARQAGSGVARVAHLGH
ncbi:MAG: GNAT family N-acetyltransferase [Candidatus Dormibacteria bacterium]